MAALVTSSPTVLSLISSLKVTSNCVIPTVAVSPSVRMPSPVSGTELTPLLTTWGASVLNITVSMAEPVLASASVTHTRSVFAPAAKLAAGTFEVIVAGLVV